jgi:hypothetical protein
MAAGEMGCFVASLAAPAIRSQGRLVPGKDGTQSRE